MTDVSKLSSTKLSNAQPLLDIRGLRKQYGPLEVLKGVDLSMQRGNVVTLIGSSGSGKTTLLRCVNMLEEFQGGRIVLDGESIGYDEVAGKRVRHPEKVIARHRAMTGMAFQQFNLFPHLTALQNVTLGLLKVKNCTRTKRWPWPKMAGAGRPVGAARPLSRPVVRRPAATRGDCPGDCDEPQPDAVRRSHFGPGSGAGR